MTGEKCQKWFTFMVYCQFIALDYEICRIYYKTWGWLKSCITMNAFKRCCYCERRFSFKVLLTSLRKKGRALHQKKENLILRNLSTKCENQYSTEWNKKKLRSYCEQYEDVCEIFTIHFRYHQAEFQQFALHFIR